MEIEVEGPLDVTLKAVGRESALTGFRVRGDGFRGS